MGRSPAKMYCTTCEDITPCRSVNFSEFGLENDRRFYKVDHSDIQWFRRLRVCDDCASDFVTAEVDERFLDELVKLREALCDIRENALEYEADAKKAAATLSKLTSSLKLLKALK